MSVVATLLTQLVDEHVQVRAAAAQRLCQLGEATGGCAPALVKAAGDEESVSAWAVSALEDLGIPPTESIAELAELTASDQEMVAYWAVTLLGRLGPEAKRTEAALVAALSESSYLTVRQRSAWALGRMGTLSAEAVDALLAANKTKDSRLARLAERALATCSTTPPET